MKKLILLIAVALLTTSLSYAQKMTVENLPVVIGSALPVDVKLFDKSQLQNTQSMQLPIINLTKGNSLNKLLFLSDVLENEKIAFSTRLQPFPENQNDIDTGRVIHNVYDPTNTDDWQYIGDTYMPTNVVDQNGNSVFKLNGYIQTMPSLSWYLPQLTNGNFTIDSIAFWIYSFPSSPVNSGYLFTLYNANSLNLPNFGANTFNPAVFEFDYNQQIYQNLQAAASLSSDYINSRIQKQETGYIIQPSSVNFDTPDLKAVRTWKNSDRIMIILAKDNLNDLSDTTELIGAWEWLVPYQQTFAGAIRHHGQGKDTVSLLSATIAPRKPAQGTPLYNEWLQKYPYFMNEKFVRKNYRFIVYGRYSGEYDPNSVRELDNSAETFDLVQNSPNPVSSQTRITFSLKESGTITLKVYNQLGEEVATLVNKYMNIGTYESTFDAQNLPSGMYFYTLSDGKHNKTLRMSVVK
jgi:hypothetical protein